MNHHEKIELLNNIGSVKKALVSAEYEYMSIVNDPNQTDATRDSVRTVVSELVAEQERLLLRAAAVAP